MGQCNLRQSIYKAILRLEILTSDTNSPSDLKLHIYCCVSFLLLLSTLSVVSNSLQPHGLYPARLLCPWDSPGKSTGVGIHSFLLEIFPTQGLNPGFLHCNQILSPMSHQGSPRILEWVACLFSRGPSQPRDWARVSFIADELLSSPLSLSCVYVIKLLFCFLLICLTST